MDVRISTYGQMTMYLRSDELETGELPPCLFVDDVLDFGVDFGERGVQDLVLCTIGVNDHRMARMKIHA